MGNALLLLFAAAGTGSIAVMWQTIASNMDAIRGLRHQMALPEYGAEVIVTLREQLTAFEPVQSVRRPRQIRVAAPKPVTHRLHQFAKARSFA